MLPESYKADILEIIEVAKACPEALQPRCLEMLLEHYLSGAAERRAPKIALGRPPAVPSTVDDEQEGKKRNEVAAPPTAPVSSNGDGDILLADLHVKAKKFLGKHGRSLSELNDLFYKDGSEFKPLYDDLKTTKTSESQIRVALLHALVAGMKDGDFQFDGEKVREECQMRKAYDVNNFSANFNNNAILFDSFDKYGKAGSVIRLSEAGRKKLAELIPDMK